MMLVQSLFIYSFMFCYAVERSIFAFGVPFESKAIGNRWLTFFPFLSYIVLCFSSMIEYSIVYKPLNFAFSLLGIFIFAIGVSFRYGSLRAFRVNKQQWNSHIDAGRIDRLIQDGLYKLVRHPYYLSVMLELCGIALLLNAFRTFVFIFLIQAPLLWKRISKEESQLMKKFSNQYLSYKIRVPAVFPLWSKKR